MKTRILLISVFLVLVAIFWRLNQPPRPDPRMVALAVRATVYALPSPTPLVLEVTRVVPMEVTRVVVITPTATATLTPTGTPEPPPEAVRPTEAAIAAAVARAPAADEVSDAAAQAELVAAPAVNATPAPAPIEIIGPAEIAAAAVETCPTSSGNTYTTIPIAGGGLEHPDGEHADLNLALRSYVPVEAPRELFNKDGPVDSDPPQLAGIFSDYRLPLFGPSYRVHDWDWGCGGRGCRAEPLDHVESTLLDLQAVPGESLGIPHRQAQIYGGGYKALVLYAESTRVTLGYTREDSVANGYVVHLENICVDPNLVEMYRNSNAAGRGFLPALREDEVLGAAGSGDVLVAVRDRGVFFDHARGLTGG